MSITDIGHTALACHDLDQALEFYALLGITESFRLKKEDGSVRLIYLHISGDRFLELFPGGPSPEERAASGPSSFRHICLLSDDIEADVEHLRSHGVTIDREVQQGLDTNKQAWVKDPDGNPIEFMQISTGSPQRAVSEGREPVIAQG